MTMILINFLFRSPPWGVHWLPIRHTISSIPSPCPTTAGCSKRGPARKRHWALNANRKGDVFINSSWVHLWKGSMFHLNPWTIPQKEYKLGIEDMFAYGTTRYRSIEETEWEQPFPSSCNVPSEQSQVTNQIFSIAISRHPQLDSQLRMCDGKHFASHPVANALRSWKFSRNPWVKLQWQKLHGFHKDFDSFDQLILAMP